MARKKQQHWVEGEPEGGFSIKRQHAGAWVRRLQVARDLAITLGMVWLAGIGWTLKEAQLASKDAQIDLLRETQYDKALEVVESQRALHEMEVERLQAEIEFLKARSDRPGEGPHYEQIQARLGDLQSSLDKWARWRDALRLWQFMSDSSCDLPWECTVSGPEGLLFLGGTTERTLPDSIQP